MRCLKCGTAIPEGSMYCPKCGSPVHIVPDYSSLENLLADEVNDVLDEDEMPSSNANDDRTVLMGAAYGRKSSDTDSIYGHKDHRRSESDRSAADRIAYERQRKREEDEYRRKKKRRSLIMILVLIAFIIAVGAYLFFSMSSNSYTYQIKKADKEYAAAQYSDALSYYTKAASIKPSSAEAYTGEGKCYIGIGDMSSAETALRQAITNDPSYADAYLTLATLYEASGDTASIKKLFESCSDSNIISKCSAYIAEVPTISPAEGSFSKAVDVTMQVSTGTIHYTIDGSAPSASSTAYTAPFTLEDNGNYTIRAISVNDKGIESQEASVQYTVDVPLPEGPTVSPQSGSYSTATSITVTVPAGSTVYYTLDGTTPTTESSTYSGAIDMPEGKTTFSCIAVNGNGKSSSVIKRQYNLIIIK